MFLLSLCVFCGAYSVAMADTTTTLASVSFVEGTIRRDTDGNVLINNGTNSSVTLSQNPQTSNVVDTNSKQVATVGWTDASRTSKVKAVEGNSTTLVDMWIE